MPGSPMPSRLTPPAAQWRFRYEELSTRKEGEAPGELLLLKPTPPSCGDYLSLSPQKGLHIRTTLSGGPFISPHLPTSGRGCGATLSISPHLLASGRGHDATHLISPHLLTSGRGRDAIPSISSHLLTSGRGRDATLFISSHLLASGRGRDATLFISSHLLASGRGHDATHLISPHLLTSGRGRDATLFISSNLLTSGRGRDATLSAFPRNSGSLALCLLPRLPSSHGTAPKPPPPTSGYRLPLHATTMRSCLDLPSPPIPTTTTQAPTPWARTLCADTAHGLLDDVGTNPPAPLPGRGEARA